MSKAVKMMIEVAARESRTTGSSVYRVPVPHIYTLKPDVIQSRKSSELQ